MTISSETTKVQFSGPTSGANNISALQIQSDDDVLVTKTSSGVDTTLTKTTDYAISADLTELTLVAELVSGEILTVSLDIELTQGTDFKNNRQNFENAETALDKLTLRAKQDSETLDRTLKLLVSSSLSNLTVPEPQAGTFLAWNSTEDALENSSTIIGLVTPSINVPADTNKILKGGVAGNTTVLGAKIPDLAGGDANKILRINSAEDGFEYSLTLPDLTANKRGAIVVQNATDDGFELVGTQGTAGQPLLSGGADALFTFDTLSVAAGGTGATSAASARTNLGVVSATDALAGLVELATDAEFTTGTDTTRVVTPSHIKTGLEMTETYTTTDITISASSTFTFNHGLTQTPTAIEIFLVCTSAELGYNAGDVVPIPASEVVAGSFFRGMAISLTSSQIRGKFCTISTVFGGLIRHDNGSASNIDLSKWKLRIKARA